MIGIITHDITRHSIVQQNISLHPFEYYHLTYFVISQVLSFLHTDWTLEAYSEIQKFS
jgi:hypothetical protein